MPWAVNEGQPIQKFWRLVLYPPPEAVEEAMALLYGLGVSSLEYEDGQPSQAPYADSRGEAGVPFVAFYVPDCSYADWRETVNDAASVHGWGFDATPVVPEDWESSWKAYYQPVALPHGYWIVPEWESLPDVPACRQVRLDPGMAFGTGTHPTTRMCLGALTAMPLRGRRLLDLGAGSGILGILALKRGATVTFVEPDPVAVQALRKNLELNRVADRATVVMGTLSALPPQQFEVVCFNVIWEVVRDSWASLVRYLAPHATVLVSGLLEERLCDMVALAKTSGLAVEEVQQEDGWVMVGLTNGQNQS